MMMSRCCLSSAMTQLLLGLMCVCVFMTLLPGEAVADHGELDSYRQTVWTDEALDHALIEFSHAIDCDVQEINSTCITVSLSNSLSQHSFTQCCYLWRSRVFLWQHLSKRLCSALLTLWTVLKNITWKIYQSQILSLWVYAMHRSPCFLSTASSSVRFEIFLTSSVTFCWHIALYLYFFMIRP